jgi:dipeptidase D
MNTEIERLEPRTLWRHFVALNAVPRGSKQERRAVDFMLEFGRGLGLETIEDAAGNVLIRKPASAGMEDRAGVVLQGHLDMVQQKNAETQFDFAEHGIDMLIDGDWVRARGTTLGADNGIGVAAAMAVLASDKLSHPALEALFTVDEETGMTGAKGLEAGLLNGEYLLNLDSENDRELTIGCAGGVDITINGEHPRNEPPDGAAFMRLQVGGLKGGHSGIDIHRGRANANKLLNRLLRGLAGCYGARVGMIDAGGLRNVIPREAAAMVAIEPVAVEGALKWVDEQYGVLRAEYVATDPGLEVTCRPDSWRGQVLETQFQGSLLRAIAACPNGIYRMSPEVAGLVQTSNNLARVRVADGQYELLCLARGSVDSEKMELAETVAGVFELIGATAQLGGAYPGWQPLPEAPLVVLLSRLYEEMFGESAEVLACHAGLECGIIGTRYPQMQMISFGPNIRGAHSPDEKVQISSVGKFWQFLLAALERVPARAQL